MGVKIVVASNGPLCFEGDLEPIAPSSRGIRRTDIWWQLRCVEGRKSL
jgi:hypothetical protein